MLFSYKRLFNHVVLLGEAMGKNTESSVVIPVYNQWHFTHKCLHALHSTLVAHPVEIIIVDNNSSDETSQLCEPLGKKLFGDSFLYHRCEKNINFGPASNLGAKLAKSEYLIFLNNDTVPLAGWYAPLIEDFTTYPDIAATGPLLVYPNNYLWGASVQHLGVFVSPALQVGHLYEGIPADSVLAKKRRFFQIITAACMVIRRELFLEVGLFDEHYINGFEDVDLCARLWDKGYRMTVNPASRMVHYTSQTPGRHSHEDANSAYFRQQSLHLLSPDWHFHLHNDNLELQLGPWQTLQGGMQDEIVEKLRGFTEHASLEKIKELLLAYPLWEEGYRALLSLSKTSNGETHALAIVMSKLWPEPNLLLAIYKQAADGRDHKLAAFILNILLTFCKPSEEYNISATRMSEWASDIGLDSLAVQYAAWGAQAGVFREELFLPFLQELWETMKGAPFNPLTTWAYTLWRELIDLPNRLTESTCQLFANGEPIAFSILMPVYNPTTEHLNVAIRSVIEQDYPYWELCLADDASSSPDVRPLLEEWCARDSRIKVTFRSSNGHIAQATNTALDMSRYPYIALLDQDDVLTPDALQVMAASIEKNPDALLFFSDEDKIFETGKVDYPHFKNGKWDWELLRCQNFVNHLGVYRADKLRAIGGFREGYRGAQDFDMLFRYTLNEECERFIHIPKVLYHWRVHAGSTAGDIGAKSEVIDSSHAALQSYLDIVSPGAEAQNAEGIQFLQVGYPLPQKQPSVSVIIDANESLPVVHAQLTALMNKTHYTKYEVIVLYSQSTDPLYVRRIERLIESYQQVRLISYPETCTSVVKWNLGAQVSSGAIVGYLSLGTIPQSEGWLERFVAFLSRPGIGGVGGRLIGQNNSLIHAGYMVDGNLSLAPIFHGLPHADPGYFAWAKLTRTVDSLDALCFFTHRRLYEQLQGFDASMAHTSIHDYCLRLQEIHHRTGWLGNVDFVFAGDYELPWLEAGYVFDPNFRARWEGRLQAVNPNLIAGLYSWNLNKLK